MSRTASWEPLPRGWQESLQGWAANSEEQSGVCLSENSDSLSVYSEVSISVQKIKAVSGVNIKNWRDQCLMIFQYLMRDGSPTQPFQNLEIQQKPAQRNRKKQARRQTKDQEDGIMETGPRLLPEAVMFWFWRSGQQPIFNTKITLFFILILNQLTSYRIGNSNSILKVNETCCWRERRKRGREAEKKERPFWL